MQMYNTYKVFNLIIKWVARTFLRRRVGAGHLQLFLETIGV